MHIKTYGRHYEVYETFDLKFYETFDLKFYEIFDLHEIFQINRSV